MFEGSFAVGSGCRLDEASCAILDPIVRTTTIIGLSAGPNQVVSIGWRPFRT
jgi:hypothetical protein